jgi:hypothetical protein
VERLYPHGMDKKWIWASLAIIAMWAAVVLVGVYGPTSSSTTATGT